VAMVERVQEVGSSVTEWMWMGERQLLRVSAPSLAWLSSTRQNRTEPRVYSRENSGKFMLNIFTSGKAFQLGSSSRVSRSG
jgi:hypothetical protein